MHEILTELGIESINSGAFAGEWLGSGNELASVSPIDGKTIAKVKQASPEDYEKVMSRAQEAFNSWRTVPAPRRGEVVRQLGNALRETLGKVVEYYDSRKVGLLLCVLYTQVKGL